MAKPSRHERIIREELEDAERELETAEAAVRSHELTAERIRSRIATLRSVLDRADVEAKEGGE